MTGMVPVTGVYEGLNLGKITYFLNGFPCIIFFGSLFFFTNYNYYGDGHKYLRLLISQLSDEQTTDGLEVETKILLFALSI